MIGRGDRWGCFKTMRLSPPRVALGLVRWPKLGQDGVARGNPEGVTMATSKPKTEKKVKTEKEQIKKKCPRKHSISRYVKKGGNGGRRAGSGRKPLEPTDAARKQVEAMSGWGVPLEQIAAVTMNGIGLDSLYKYFERELVDGKARANAKVGQTLFQRATTGGDTTAAIWWTKTQMRWKDTSRIELTGADGGPVQITKIKCIIVDPKQITVGDDK